MGVTSSTNVSPSPAMLSVLRASPAHPEKCHIPGKQSSVIIRLLIVRKVGIHVQHGGVEVAANIFELEESLVRQACRGGSGKARDDFAPHTIVEPNRGLGAPFADQEGAGAGPDEVRSALVWPALPVRASPFPAPRPTRPASQAFGLR